MERKIIRTITEVLDCETGECIDANEFFRKPLDELTVYRSELQKAIEGLRDTLFTCFYCKQKIRIRGGIAGPHKRKVEIFHFAHLKDSDDCHIKTKNHYTKEEVERIKYNGAKESKLHQTLKEQIAECLRRNEETKNEISCVEVEKTIRDKVAKEWRKPDINAIFHGKRIAIELQLSTTWLDVITKRQHFYKKNGIYIFWVFHTFDLSDDTRKLTYNDVIYTNNQNAYVFDKEAYDLSRSENDLILKCYFKKYFRKGHELFEKWECSFIRLIDLTFNTQNHRVFYHDTETQKRVIGQEIEKYISTEKQARRLQILQEQEHERRKKENECKIEILNQKIKDIIENKTKIEQREIIAKKEKQELVEFEINIADTSEKIIEYLTNTRKFIKPFNGHNALLKTIRREYEEKVISVSQTISEKIRDRANLEKDLSEINKQPIIEINDRKYSVINESSNWDFIKEYYSRIMTIHKKFVDGLFATENIKPINRTYSFNQMLFLKDYLFLIDFSAEIKELNENIKNYQIIIEQQEALIKTIKEEIRNRLEAYLRQRIWTKEKELQDYSEKIVQLNKRLHKMKNDIRYLVELRSLL